MENKTIRLSCFGIVVELNDQDCGTIQSTLQEICPYCNNQKCDGFCREWEDAIDIYKNSEKIYEEMRLDNQNFIAYRSGIHGIESLILGHAVAGVDITDSAYIRGIETAVDALSNNI